MSATDSAALFAAFLAHLDHDEKWAFLWMIEQVKAAKSKAWKTRRAREFETWYRGKREGQ